MTEQAKKFHFLAVSLYITQTHGLGKSAARVGHDGGMHVTAGEYHRMAIVLSEVDSASCL